MQFIQDFIDGFVGIIESVYGFFSGLVNNFILFFQYLVISMSTSKNIVSTLPDWLQVFGTVCLTICVLYMVLGREAGGD